MSRIGRKAIPVPDKVKVEQRGRVVVVEGPLGKLEALLRLVHVEPCEGCVTANHTLLVVECCPVGIGV